MGEDSQLWHRDMEKYSSKIMAAAESTQNGSKE